MRAGPRFRYVVLFSMLVGSLWSAWASAESVKDEGASTPVDALPKVIDSVEIITENVFDPSDPRYNNLLFRLANHTHVVTRKAKIRREILLHKGDCYDTALAAESVRNLRQLDYLYKSDIRMKTGDRGENILAVTTSDKWTTSGGISPGQSGGWNHMEINLTERNFLGWGMYVSHELFYLEEERTFYQAEIRDARMWGSNLAGAIGYSDDPRWGRFLMSLGRPFYSLQQRWSWEVSRATIRKRLDYYLDGRLAARDRLVSNTVYSSVQYRVGGDRLKYYFIFLHGYAEVDDVGRKHNDSLGLTPETIDRMVPAPGTDSLHHYLQGAFRIRQIRFAEYRRLNRFQKPEDINLGLNAQLTMGLAIPIHLTRYWYWRVNSEYTAARGSWLLTIGASGQEWRSEKKTLRMSVSYYGKTYWRYHPNWTLVTGANFLSDRLARGEETVYLDEDRGLRGYPRYFDGGASRCIINIENRLLSNLETMSVGIGGAMFADIGNIWAKGARPTWRQTLASVGGGLRLGIDRSASAEVVRVDLAYALNRGCWQVSVGTQQYF